MAKRLHNFSYILAFISLILFVGGAIGIRDSLKTPHNYDTVKTEELSKGDIVEGSLFFNLGPFMESYTTNYGVKSGDSYYYYIIPIEDTYTFMGFKVNSTSDIGKELEVMEQDSYLYLLGERDTLPSAIPFTGKVKPLSSKELEYMKEDLSTLINTDEIEDYIFPYYIDYMPNTTNNYALLGIGIGGLLAAVVLWVLTRQKKIPAKPVTVADVLN